MIPCDPQSDQPRKRKEAAAGAPEETLKGLVSWFAFHETPTLKARVGNPRTLSLLRAFSVSSLNKLHHLTHKITNKEKGTFGFRNLCPESFTNNMAYATFMV